ncbi:MAG TPA: ribonuclease P protein component [Flavisolibacter sp.]|jgi:ribonuclease P protein component|nr:ribonuclease P protein component [Flavisolibacter sp.]
MVKPFALPATERLKSRKQIDGLFARGKSFGQFPLRVIYSLEKEEQGKVQMGVTASKKHFKKAVDRNRIKRLLREAYRLQKTELKEWAEKEGWAVCVFFIYTDKEIAPYSTVYQAMGRCLQTVREKLLNHENPQ